MKPRADPAFVGPGTSTLRRSYLRKSIQEKDAIPTFPSIAVGGTLCHQEPPSSGCISVLGNEPVHERPQTAPARFLQTVTGLSSRPCEGSMALSPGTATAQGCVRASWRLRGHSPQDGDPPLILLPHLQSLLKCHLIGSTAPDALKLHLPPVTL